MATLQDVKDIVILGKELFMLHIILDREYYELSDMFEEDFNKWIINQIHSDSGIIFVAEEKNIILGFISGYIKTFFPWFRNRYLGQISYLAINQKYRRQGIGKLLQKKAISWFKSKNISYVELFVDEENKGGACAWYAYGFKPFRKLLRKKI